MLFSPLETEPVEPLRSDHPDDDPGHEAERRESAKIAEHQALEGSVPRDTHPKAKSVAGTQEV